MFKKFLFVVVCLITLVALAYSFEKWRGKHAWETYQRDREAKGDSFEWSSIVQPPLPDAENFAATPLFAELFPKPPAHPRLEMAKLPNCPEAIFGDWRVGRVTNLASWQTCFTNDNLLAALSVYDPILNEITAAGQRAKSRFPIHYERTFDTLLAHLGYLRSLVQIYRLRALAELAAGQTDAALADVQMCLRLANTVKDEPIVISFLVQTATLSIAIQPVWEGLAAHRWSDTQLATLQAEFERLDQFAGFAKAIQGERLFEIANLRWLIERPGERYEVLLGWAPDSPRPLSEQLIPRVVPIGWLYQNMLSVDRFYTETYLPAIDFEHHLISPRAIDRVEVTIEKQQAPYNTLCRLLVVGLINIPKKVAISQTAIDQVTLACALERYRLAKGELPENLAALVTPYLKHIPADIITGAPLHYQRTSPDRFILYSVGWNGTDDHGEIVLNKGRNPWPNFDQGDWVWKSNP